MRWPRIYIRMPLVVVIKLLLIMELSVRRQCNMLILATGRFLLIATGELHLQKLRWYDIECSSHPSEMIAFLELRLPIRIALFSILPSCCVLRPATTHSSYWAMKRTTDHPMRTTYSGNFLNCLMILVLLLLSQSTQPASWINRPAKQKVLFKCQ